MTAPNELSSTHDRPRRLSQRLSQRNVAGIGLVLAAALLYALTLDNGLQPYELHGGDLITHQYAQVQARPSNAPGYPLYTMGGWLWFHAIRSALSASGLAHPNPIPILSSYSTLWALAALWLLFQVICETTISARHPSGNWQAGLLFSAFYAVTYFFWYYATTTEQYSSAVAQTLAILYLFILWNRDPDNHRLLFLLAFVCGLSLAHMLTVAFIVPPIVVAALWRDPKILRSPRTVLACITAAVLPLLSYAYVYLRGAQHPEWRGAGEWESASAWFLAFVSTAQGREELLWGFEPGRSFFGNGFPELIVHELGWFMLGIGLVGIAALKRPLPFILYNTLAIYALFSWAYRYGNWFQVILPAYPLILVGAGAAIDRVQSLIRRRAPDGRAPEARLDSRSERLRPGVLTVAPLVVVVAAIVWRMDASLPEANSRSRPQDTALQRAALLIAHPLPHNSALFASVDDALALQYLTNIWSLHPDLRVVSSAQADEALARTPVYSTWDAAPTLLAELELAPMPRIQAISPDWLALVPTSASDSVAESLSAPQPSAVLDRTVADGVVMLGYRVDSFPSAAPAAHTVPAIVDLTIFWRLEDGIWPEGLGISVRPTRGGAFMTGADGALLQIDRIQPVNGLADLNAVNGHAIVADPYRLETPAPEERPDGAAVIVYRAIPGGFEDVARVDVPLR